MARATGDILPDHLIHKILSYLNLEEAAPMKVISKTWLQACLMTKANLVLEVHSHKHIRIVDKIMEIYRYRKFLIDKFIFQSVREFDSREVFLLFDKWLGVALQNGVKDLVFRVPGFSYHFPIFKVLASKSLRKLVLRGCDLTRFSLSSCLANCDSLRKLSLSYVRLDEQLLQALLTSCPLIVSFTLEHCGGLTKIELQNLQNIRSVSIGTNRNQHVKIHAPTLEHLSYFGARENLPMLDIVERQNLKSLEIFGDSTPVSYLDQVTGKISIMKELESLYNCLDKQHLQYFCYIP